MEFETTIEGDINHQHSFNLHQMKCFKNFRFDIALVKGGLD